MRKAKSPRIMGRARRSPPTWKEWKGEAKPSRTPASAWVAMWLPSALAVTLSLPGLHYSWLWDDYDFASRVLALRPSFLLPDPTVVFYRPLSREIYFGAIWLAGGGSPLVGHLANAALLALVTWLFSSFVARLSSRRAGVFAGVAFASLGATPLLVAWVSGAQDLLAILFGLLALRFSVGGRPTVAACALGAAILSKETALALLPIVAAMPWILGRRPERFLKWCLPFVILAVAWAAIHPAPRLLFHRGFAGSEVGHVGVGSSGWDSSLVSTLLSLVNLPPVGVPAGLLEGRLTAGVIAGLLGIAVIALSWKGRLDTRARGSLPRARRVVLLGSLLMLLPLVLTASLVRDWAPYYAVFPSLGVSLLVGVGLARARSIASGVTLLAFLSAGLWTRGMAAAPTVPCERNLDFTSRALTQVEATFKRLHPHLPAQSQALVSVASTGSQGVNTHMHRFQALRVWYRDPSIVTLAPERFRPGARTELLFRVTPALDVVEIDPVTFRFYHTGSELPTSTEVNRPLRSYARGLAACGRTNDAIRILDRLSQIEVGLERRYDERMIGMVLLGAGRGAAAESALRQVPGFPRDVALGIVEKIYLEPTGSAALDSCSFPAFGLFARDPETIRCLMHRFHEEELGPQTLEFARRLQGLVPGDVESHRIIVEAARHVAPIQRLSRAP